MLKNRHSLLFPLFFALFSLFLFQARAQDLDISGKWKGAISIPGVELEIVLDFEKDGKAWKGTIDIPLQKVAGQEVADIEVAGQTVKWKLPWAPGGANFEGSVSSSNEKMEGDFKQSGQVFPLLVRRESAAERAAAEKRLAEAIAQIRSLADSLAVRRHVPGYGIAIVYKGEVVLSEGFGYRDLEKKIKADARTNFSIGSSSKAFTALCLGILADEGKLDWDEPVRTYLPDFKMHDDFATEQMTAVDLLCHRSGLPRHDFVWYGSTATREELYHRLPYLKPNKPFRYAWQYQNLMFMTAGYLAGKLNGGTWEEMVAERIFKPLEMNRSNFALAGLKAQENTAKGYRWDKVEKKMRNMNYRDLSAIGPAGSINSNAEDMANWLKLQLNQGKYKEQTVVKAVTLNMMHRPQMPIPQGGSEFISAPSYGLGWMTYQYKGHEVVEHGGNIDGFSAEVWLMPSDEMGMVVLSNANATPVPTLLCRYAADLLLDLEKTDWEEKTYGKNAEKEKEEKKGKEKEKEKNAEPVKGTKPSHPLAEYAGDYLDPGYGLVQVSFDGKALKAKMNSFDIPLSHWHYDVFEGRIDSIELELKLTFHGNEVGSIDRLTIPIEILTDDIEFKKQAPQLLSDPAFLARLEGKYELEELTISIDLVGSHLVMTPTGQPSFKLLPWRNTEFKAEGLNGYSVEFIEGKDGKFGRAIIHQPNGNFPAERKE